MFVFSDRTVLRLHDVVDNCDTIFEYIEGMNFARFKKDRRTIDAVERCLQRITEAVIQMGTEDFARAAPELPMAQIRAMGNALRHDYRRIDPKVVFLTATDDLPPLRAVCVAALAL